MSTAPLLGVTRWLSWTVRPVLTGTGQTPGPVANLLSIPSLPRLLELSPRLREANENPGGLELHRLLRFNLLNLGENAVTVVAIALTNATRETVRCEVVPPVVVRAGARYPFMVEVTTGLGSEAVDIQVEDTHGERVWASAACLPSA